MSQHTIDPAKLSTTVLLALRTAIDRAARVSVTTGALWTTHDLDTVDIIDEELYRREAHRNCTTHFEPLISPDACHFCEVTR